VFQQVLAQHGGDVGKERDVGIDKAIAPNLLPKLNDHDQGHDRPNAQADLRVSGQQVKERAHDQACRHLPEHSDHEHGNQVDQPERGPEADHTQNDPPSREGSDVFVCFVGWSPAYHSSRLPGEYVKRET